MPTAGDPSSRRSSRSSRAWACVVRVSRTSASSRPSTTTMFWSKNAYRRTNTRSPTSTQPVVMRASYVRATANGYDRAVMEPAQPVPSISEVQVADGTNLRTLTWPAAGDPIGLALIVHGLGEYDGRYATVAEALTTAGIETHA